MPPSHSRFTISSVVRPSPEVAALPATRPLLPLLLWATATPALLAAAAAAPAVVRRTARAIPPVVPPLLLPTALPILLPRPPLPLPVRLPLGGLRPPSLRCATLQHRRRLALQLHFLLPQLLHGHRLRRGHIHGEKVVGQLDGGCNGTRVGARKWLVVCDKQNKQPLCTAKLAGERHLAHVGRQPLPVHHLRQHIKASNTHAGRTSRTPRPTAA